MPNPLRVLLIEDDDDHYQIIQRMSDRNVGQRLTLIRESTLMTGLGRVKDSSIDAILLDLRLPDSNGLETLVKTLAAVKGTVPIIVLTSLDDQEMAVSAIREGAQDFLCKGMLTGYILSNSLRNAIERKRIDQKISQNSMRMELIQKASQVACWEWDVETGGVTWSGDLESVLGKDFNKYLCREDWMERIHEEDRARVDQIMQETLINGGQFLVHFRLLWSDDSYHWIMGRGAAFGSLEDRNLKMFGINSDETERLRNEAEKERQNDIIRTIAENAGSGLFMTNESGFITYSNPAATEATGFEKEEFQGRRLEDILRSQSLASKDICSNSLYSSQLSDNSNQIFEDVFQRKDGRALPVQLSVSPIIRAEGQRTGYVIEMQDITRWKLMESELLAAKDQAEAGSRAKSRFLANMSHEIRTPLFAVLGYSDLLANEFADSKKRSEYAKVIRENGLIVVSIINDILDLSKVETETLMTQVDVIDAQLLFSEIAAIFNPKAAAKGIDLKFSIEVGSPLSFQSDPLRLRQILINVLGNSLKFTHSGTVEVTARSCQWKGKASFEIVVSDSGIGIPPTMIDRLFEPFTQVDASATRKYGGAGLGLAIARRLARALGGDVLLQHTELGKGSSFSIIIDPGIVSSYQSRAGASSPLDSKTAVADQSLEHFVDGVSVLLVEDSLDTQFIVEMILRSVGANVTIANNGQEAIDRIESQKDFDIVLMDLQMPVMDGFAALKHLRTTGYSRPVLAFTAHALKEDRIECLDAGFNDHIIKPINRDVLIERILFHVARETDV